MALVSSGSFGSPTANYELYAEQTGGSGNQRTIKVTFKIKIANRYEGSSYGFPLNWKARVHNSYSDWMFVKDNSYWKSPMDWKTYTWTQTVDVGTANATNITVGFQLEYPRGSSSWNQTRTGTFQTGQTNVAPSQPGWIAVRPGRNQTPLSGTISENINNFFIDWGASSDGNGDTVYYDLQEQRNGGSWTSIDGHGSDTAHQFSTTGGEGTTYYYRVNARDNKGGASGWTYSGKITKNVFTMATLASSSSVNYSGNPLTFTYSGGSNTQGGLSVSYSISCEQLTVYNGSNFSSGSQVKFNWGQNGGTTGAYINWNDLVNHFKGSQGRGTLTFVLTGRNSNGTTKTSKKTISVNIQTSPGSISGASIVEDGSRSTAYRRVKDTGAWYFIPDGSKTVQVNWNRANGNIGDSVKYRIYVSYNNGGWQELATVNNPPYTHVVPKQSSSVTFKYMIRALSSFNEGLYSEAQTPSKTLHYYNGVSLSRGAIVRTGTYADVKVTVKSNTSIPGMKTTGNWSSRAGNGDLTSSQGEQNIRIGGLTDSASYIIRVTYNDTTGFSSDQTEEISVGANQSIFYVNRHGVGVGGNKADSSYTLNVKGKGRFTDGIQSSVPLGANVDLNNYRGEGEFHQDSDANARSGRNYPAPYAGHLTVTIGAGTQQRYHVYNSDSIYVRAKYSSQEWTPWKKIITESGGTIAGKLVVGEIEESNILGGTGIAGTGSAPDANLVWKSGFYDFQGGKHYPPGRGDWYWLINAAHGANNEGYRYNLQIAGDFWEQGFFIRRTNHLGEGTWQRIMTTSTFDAEEVGAVSEKGGSIIHGTFGQFGGTMEAGGDFNTYLTEGEYAVAGENHKNGPVKGATHLYGKLMVKVSDGGTHNNRNNWVWQIFVSTEWDGIFMRRKVNGADWTPWKVAPMTEAPSAYITSTLELEVDPKERISALEEEVAELKETIKELIEGKALK